MLKKKFTIILVIMIILALTGICNKIYAATSSISTSKNSVKVGDTITVTISGNAASWNVNLLSNGPVKANGTTSFSNATDSGENENITIGTVTYTATADGTVSFNLAGQLVDSNYKSSDASGSAKVTVSSQSSNTKNVNNNNTNNNNNSNANNKTTTQEPTFTTSNKTAYATGDINVRSSYSSSSSAVGYLKKGDSVTIIGVGSNGWSKVTYNGKTAYIKSDLLTTTKPAEDKKSANKALKSLEIESVSLEPEFNKETTNYSVTVGKDVDSLKINAQAEDEKSKVTITGNEELKMGENTVKISVTAEDGTVRTYTILVNKKEEEAKLGLASLKINGVSLKESFKSNVYEYSVDLKGKEELTKLDITAKANNENATIEIKGNDNFVVGENTVTITVKSRDGEESVTYKIVVNKPEKTSVTSTNEESASISNNKMFLYVSIGIFTVALLLIILIIVRSIKKSKRNNSDEDEENDDEYAYGFNYNENNNITEELYGIKNKNESLEGEIQEETNKTRLYDIEKEVDFSDEERRPRRKGKHSK